MALNNYTGHAGNSYITRFSTSRSIPYTVLEFYGRAYAADQFHRVAQKLSDEISLLFTYK